MLKGGEYAGLLGLYVDSEGVKVLAQENTYYPQIQVYKFFHDNPIHDLSIHTLFRFISCFSITPEVNVKETNNGNLIIELDGQLDNPYLGPKGAIIGRLLREGLLNREGQVFEALRAQGSINNVWINKQGKFDRSN